MSNPLDCDVLIIGSGAGGATTAVVLAEAGFDVLILEEGPYVAQGEVQPFSLEQMNRQYRSGGVTVALGLPSIAYTEGRCAGGGTEVNSGLYLRPPVEVVERCANSFRSAISTPTSSIGSAPRSKPISASAPSPAVWPHQPVRSCGSGHSDWGGKATRFPVGCSTRPTVRSMPPDANR